MPADTDSDNHAKQAAKVLLIDDDLDICREYARSLRRAGLTVEVATSAGEALSLLELSPFDVVLSDISMPAMSGLELLRAVREWHLDLPVLLMTGSPSVETAVLALDYGAAKYLTKPIRQNELAEAVWRAVDLHALARLRRQVSDEEGTTSPQLGERAALEVRFGTALESIWIAYQPIVRYSAQEPFGYEALLRSTEPSLARPHDLLDAASRLRRLHDVGRTVRRLVAASLSGPDAPELVFLNLHPHDLNDNELLSADSPLSRVASRVVLEVTERAALDEVSGLSTRLAALRRAGFRIALDDLGAGYAGLSSFSRLEPDFVKLDMSLVRDVHKNSTKQKVIRSMTALSQDMGMTVVAEGVETVEERDTLIDLDCDLLQGFLFARPGKPFPEVKW